MSGGFLLASGTPWARGTIVDDMVTCVWHDVSVIEWNCPLCAIDEMHARAVLREPDAEIVFGDDWVMVVNRCAVDRR